MTAPSRLLDWDDLRFVLAVAESGSLSGAARTLAVNQSTVHRRLAALERRLKVRLFDRLPEGQRPTLAGTELVQAAERVADEVEGLARRLAGRDLEPAGSVRLTAPDDVAARLLLKPLAAFRAAQPLIRLELVLDNRFFNLSRREADIAVRPTRRPPETLIGRRVGPVATALYGLSNFAGERDLARLPWIAWDEGVGPTALALWLKERVPAAALVWRSNSLLNQLQAAEGGLGVALLPCFLGDGATGLQRLMPPDPALETDLWLLTHPDLRQSARVRLLLDALFQHLRTLRPRLAGQAGGTAG